MREPLDGFTVARSLLAIVWGVFLFMIWVATAAVLFLLLAGVIAFLF